MRCSPAWTTLAFKAVTKLYLEETGWQGAGVFPWSTSAAPRTSRLRL